MNLSRDLIKKIQRRVLKWYSQHGRALPWRGTKDPYKIWLCEIILQQTRIEQGTSYYLRFLEQFPTLEHLAQADETQILKAWEGLGYYTRARNLMKTAKIVYHQYQGHFPQTYEELLKLPGIGPYTASAIGSICFNLPILTIDGNVRRVLSRLFELHNKPDSPPLHQIIQQIAKQVISKKYPGNFNQGLMDIGSIICIPIHPKCRECPLIKCCSAYQHGTQSLFPEKKNTRPLPVLHWAVFVILNKDEILITREENQNFLKNLYALPTVEMDEDNHKINNHPENIFIQLTKQINLPNKVKWDFLLTTRRKYSHRTIHFHVYITRLKFKKLSTKHYLWVPLKDVPYYPFSRAFTDIIKQIPS